MRLEVLEALNAERAARRAALLVTDLELGEARLVREHEVRTDDLSEPLATALRTGRSGQVEHDGRSIFVNVHLPPPRLVAIGAVHIAQAMLPIARIAGLDLEIIDPRTAFATPQRFEGARLLAEWPEDALQAHPLDSYCAVAALTHDPKIDDAALVAALAARCFYVGALGSRKTHARRVERLADAGVPQVELDRIHSPIGLDIGASNPAEIAVAVVAEIIAAFRARGLAEAEA